MIIYTVGNAAAYWTDIRRCAPEPVYKTAGGSVWKTKEEAAAVAARCEGYAVFGVFADWFADTYEEAEDDGGRRLNRNAVIVESRLPPKCHISPVLPFPMPEARASEYVNRVDANGAFYMVMPQSRHQVMVWRYTPIRPLVDSLDRRELIALRAVLTPSASERLEQYWEGITHERLRKLVWMGLIEEVQTPDGYQYAPTAVGYTIAETVGLMDEYDEWADDRPGIKGIR